MSQESKVSAVAVRAAFPQCVKVADEFRAAFGVGVKLTYASENGREIGAEIAGTSRGAAVTVAQMVLNPTPVEEPKRRTRNGA